ncbi:MAG: hypothetical protein M5R36_26680 [Deltaproteobacteria bacterium]|nr:hypothetical protein [Deltaproteobacteria bacterium]
MSGGTHVEQEGVIGYDENDEPILGETKLGVSDDPDDEEDGEDEEGKPPEEEGKPPGGSGGSFWGGGDGPIQWLVDRALDNFAGKTNLVTMAYNMTDGGFVRTISLNGKQTFQQNFGFW